MSKHSFAPKLNPLEELVLRSVSAEWTQGDIERDSTYSGTFCALVSRGLISRRPVYKHIVGGRKLVGHEYRISKRGELMLARWQRQQADRKWRQGLRESEAA